jgi:putative flippase GtrA
MSRQFLKFLVAGGIAAIVNLVSRYELNRFTPFEVAVVIAYLLGFATA